MNAVMRRIDLFCKLAGPLFVSLLTIKSSSFAAVFLAASNVASLPFEYFFIRFVYKRFPDLAAKPQRQSPPLTERFLVKVIRFPQRTISSWKIYYQSPLFLASFALCTLYFTVLSFGGSMIAFLSQYSGFSTPLIAGLRAIAVIVGLVATFAAPRLIRVIGPVRAGLWSLSWQTVILAPAVVALFIPVSPAMQGGLLVGFVSVSRLGLWGFDLCEQLLVQQVRPPLT
jgi:solute carrier family 40 (iron-regulated transporter), member 1